ncbi:toxin-antitoxin system protein [Mucisphaera calidilacus]|uniref:Uncharacterized protein n=1 Tax=Mucisphaera calidilacus TaxID=2527982 RepID=A0A518C0X3_9BACT|nr:toxin-antitoxin system protein [Mucisphaera calidilacus]QDU72844.1 hypothetical protein Pan265_27200 [Mucisphaera calidilacus]
MSLTVRIDPRDHDTLKALSQQTQRPMTDLLAEAIQGLKRQLILTASNSGYERLHEESAGEDDATAWDDATVGDVDAADWSA